MSWPDSKQKSPPRRLSTIAPVTPGVHTIEPVDDLLQMLQQRVAAALGRFEHEAVLLAAERQPVGEGRHYRQFALLLNSSYC